MVRNYQKKTCRGQVSADVLKNAAEAVIGGASLRSTADTFEVPRETLRRAVKKRRDGQELKTFTDGCKTRQVFTVAEETELTEYILKASRIGFPLDTKTIRSLAFQLAERNHKPYPSTWSEQGLAGLEWMRGFLKRHQCIGRRIPEATSLARATAFNKTNVDTFFGKLQELCTRYSFAPERMYNLDETGVTTSQKPQKVIAETGVKQVAQIVSHERGQTVSLCGFINAIGNSLPPCLIFPRAKMQNHMLHNAPPGTHGIANRSGWMTGEIFPECLGHFVQHSHSSNENPTLLLLDNHESHVTLEAVDFCKEHGIHLLSFPPHRTHRLQPLDCAVYGPFKKYYNVACNEWMVSNPGKRMTIHEVAGLVGKAYPKAFTPTNILSGFKRTGISPLDANVFSEEEFLQSYVTDNPPLITQPEQQREADVAPAESQEGVPVEAVQPEQSGSSVLPENEQDPDTSGQNEPPVQNEQTTNATGFQTWSPEVVRPHPKACHRTPPKEATDVLEGVKY